MRASAPTRRDFLRAAGIALAVPFLPSLGWKAFAREQTRRAPLRFGFMYTPNGFNQAAFNPATVGAAWELTPTLAPLGRLRDQITLCTGLDRTFAPGTSVHGQCGSCWLSSSPPTETLDGGFPTNITLDQMIARQFGEATVFPSLELSANDHTDNRETKYFESISWYGPGYAANTEKNPRHVFRRLYGAAPGDTEERSILDAVLGQAQSLRGRLGGDDRRKLDEYLESVRATERQIQRAELAVKRLGRPPIPEPGGIPENRGEYLRLMGDLTVLAFQNDLTRVATLLVDPERWDTPRMYHGVFDSPQNHHNLTHTKGDEAKDRVAAIDRFHIAQFAYLVERLRAIPEGDGTLLDNCLMTLGSGISDGDSHDYKDLQVILAGRAGGAVQPGVHHHFGGEVPLANLWLSLARAAGVQRDRFADSTAALTQVIASR
jgi:hypothetical protein